MARPRIASPALDAAVAMVIAGEATAQEAGARHGVAWRTVHRRAQEARQGGDASPASPSPSLKPVVAPTPAQDARRPQGDPDPAARWRRMVATWAPDALTRCEAALQLDAEAFEADLLQPLDDGPIDTLATASRAVRRIEAELVGGRVDPVRRASLEEKLVAALRELRQIQPPPPAPPPPDYEREVLEKHARGAIERIEFPLAEAERACPTLH